MMVGIFGHAAPRTLFRLQALGGKPAAATAANSAEGFFVKGKQGPLADGELERACAWAKKLAKD